MSILVLLLFAVIWSARLTWSVVAWAVYLVRYAIWYAQWRLAMTWSFM